MTNGVGSHSDPRRAEEAQEHQEMMDAYAAVKAAMAGWERSVQRYLERIAVEDGGDDA